MSMNAPPWTRLSLLLLPGLFALFALQACNSSGSDEEECPGDSTTLVVEVTAPAGVSGAIHLSGPGGFRRTLTGTDTLEGLAAGEYSLSYARLKVAGDIVGKAYYARAEEPVFTLRPCVRKTVSVAWTQEPGSEHLFVASRGGSSILAFSAAKLAAGGEPAPDATLKLKGGPTSPRALAFDPHGNLWFAHSAGISMFAMGDLGDSDAEVARTLDGAGLLGGSSSGATGLAFAPDSSLWVALPGEDKVVRLSRDQLAASGKPVPLLAVSNSDTDEPRVLAFDADGNLWVAVKTATAADALLRFDRAKLSATYTGASDARIVVRTAAQAYGGITALAFDKDGNLLVGYSTQDVLVRLPKASLAASADSLAPAALLTGVAVGATFEGVALDEAGGAWTTASPDAFLRVAPSLLGTSGALVAERRIVDASVGVANGIALNPAPEDLPLAD